MKHTPLTVPKESYADMAHSLGDATLNSIPVVGPAAAFLFNELIRPAYSRRQAEFWEEVAERLQALEEDDRVSVEQLRSDPAFTDALMQASLIVTRTSSEEKREALRNAVLNSALPNAPNESRQMIFLNWIDSYTPLHLRFLNLFADPCHWFTSRNRDLPIFRVNGSLAVLVKNAYPDLHTEEDLSAKIVKDLYQDGLIDTDDFYSNIDMGALDNRASALGYEFLKYIKAPAV